MADTFLPISIENFHITTPSDLPSEFINDNQVNDQVTATQIRTLIDVKMAEIQTDMAAKMRTLQTGMKNDFASVTAKIVEHNEAIYKKISTATAKIEPPKPNEITKLVMAQAEQIATLQATLQATETHLRDEHLKTHEKYAELLSKPALAREEDIRTIAALEETVKRYESKMDEDRKKLEQAEKWEEEVKEYMRDDGKGGEKTAVEGIPVTQWGRGPGAGFCVIM